jgi:aerobic carbon-monoxide dehydrogenase small subunit
MTAISLTVNGKAVRAEVAPRTHLADFLREHLLLTGTHIGCEHGICGACTVEINGEIARSCITFAVACDGAEVRSIESFDEDALMQELRQAFTQQHALQCGYCTPGMLIAARDLLRRKSGLDRRQIRSEMSGNLCRCTGYIGIINAIEQVMAAKRPGAADATGRRNWLGPPPGPLATAAASAEHGLVSRAATARPAAATRPRQPSEPASQPPRPLRVRIETIQTPDGRTKVSQRFQLGQSCELVWQLVSDIERLARCLPGLRLDGPPVAERVGGRLEVKLGPITAGFAGEAHVHSEPAARRLSVEGRGADRKGGSNVVGSVVLQLEPTVGSDGQSTAVTLELTYQLVGPLAQIGRPGIVRDLARRLGETFAHNMQAQLSDGAATAGGAVSALGLLAEIARDRLRNWLRRLAGRRSPQ